MKYLNQFFDFIKDLIKSREMIFELTKQDFRSKYLGSYLGLLWAFVNPTITILIFWFVFHFGFKSTAVGDFPFILWLMSGMLPWFFFAESVSSATNSVIEKSYLVQKVFFRISILPIIKILAALLIHVFFFALLIAMFLAYGYTLQMYHLQLFYYLFAMIALILGLSWITSSVIIFFERYRADRGCYLCYFHHWIYCFSKTETTLC